MDPVSWAGVVALSVQLVQGGLHVAKHFRLTSECCGKRSGISWDVDTTPTAKPAVTVDAPAGREEGK